MSNVGSLALRPAAEMGEKGINELYRQTVGLLNLTEVPHEVFGRQLAFNLLPSTGVLINQVQDFDRRTREEAARMLSMELSQVSLASAFLPMFHGHALAVTLVFEEPPDLEILKSLARTTRGLRLIEDPALFSPVDLAGEECVAIVNLHADSSCPTRINLWSFCDNLKGGATLNAVRIAERVADLRRAAA